MTTRPRDLVPALLFAAVGVWAMAYATLYGFGWNDYSVEVAPAYGALSAGHVWSFLTLAPAYGGSLELRAPFALAPRLWGGGAVAIYQSVSIACLAAAALFAVWLLARMRALGHDRLARATALGLCVANPLTYYALGLGHAEELLGAVLCVAAVLAARSGRAGWAGVLLGLAIANKQWALLAIGPVLIALPAQRLRTLLWAGAIAAAFYVPLLLPSLAGHSGGAAVAQSGGGAIFQPWQLWWFLGSHGHTVLGSFGVVKHGYRTPPGWLGSIPHPLIVALAVPASALAWRRGRRDALLLLAFLFALRFALDTWDTVYYPLPFVFALLAWEVEHLRRPPVLALVASVAAWLVYIVAPEHVSADTQAALFTALAVPTLVALATALYAPRRSWTLRRAHALPALRSAP